MKIVFWGKGARGTECLRALHEHQYNIVAVIGSYGKSDTVGEYAEQHGLPLYKFDDPNDDSSIRCLQALDADIFVLGGYGKILKERVIDIPRKICINLHGGKLPDYRGSSPMNWALINGDKSITITVIKVDSGVDTGDILLERTFAIDENTTIKELHEIANSHFPSMLLEVVEHIKADTLQPIKHERSAGGYFPLRFPDDGFILWDMLSAQQVHNYIRALTRPYPPAFTFYKNQKVLLLRSKLQATKFYGTPGRIYMKSDRNGVLVCASDRCLWITDAIIEETGEQLFNVIARYETLASMREAVLTQYVSR